jgi:hypothetical protein
MGISNRIQSGQCTIATVEARQHRPLTGVLFMKSLSIIAALALGLTTQAGAAEPEAKLNPGVAPKLAHKFVPKYDIEPAKVAEGVKFANPVASKGLNPQPEPPSRAIMQSLPPRE